MGLPHTFRQLAESVNNWGRWGSDDQRGTLNFITPQRLAEAAREVVRGDTFSLAMPLSEEGPQAGLIAGRNNPVLRMTQLNQRLVNDALGCCNNDDQAELSLQGATHWDSLAHVSYRGQLYNGFSAESVDESGASYCGIDCVGTLQGRAILLDIAASEGVEQLPPGFAIGPEQLDRAVERQQVTVKSGDIVLIRTGHIRHFHAGDRIAYGAPSPGVSIFSCEWFHQHQVAAVATDTLTFEVFPQELNDGFLAVHLLHLVEMGLLQGQNFDLEALAADCAADGRYSCFLTASPEPFVGATGGLVCPVAIK